MSDAWIHRVEESNAESDEQLSGQADGGDASRSLVSRLKQFLTGHSDEGKDGPQGATMNTEASGASSAGGLGNSLKGAASSFAAPIGAAAAAAMVPLRRVMASAGGKVATAIGVPQGVGTALTSLLLAGVLATGGVAISSGLSADDVARMVGVTEEECEQAYAAVDKEFGFGENEIPEYDDTSKTGTVSGITYSPSGLPIAKRGSVCNIEFSSGAAAAAYCSGAPSGAPYRFGSLLASKYNDYHDEYGFSRLGENGPIMAAISQDTFGEKDGDPCSTGDLVKFYLDDGTEFEIIVIDVKGSDKFSYWGHRFGEGIDLIECWWSGNGTAYNSINDAFAAYVENELGADPSWSRVVGWTNEGSSTYAEEAGLIASGSAVYDATSNSKAARHKAAGEVDDECKSYKTTSYSNEDLVQAALSLSYTRKVYVSEGYTGTTIWKTVNRNIRGSDAHQWDCGSFVAISILWSGTDDDYPNIYTGSQLPYLQDSPRWEEIGEGFTVNDTAESYGLEPGDVFIKHSGSGTGHTYIYLGEENVAEFLFSDEASAPGPVEEGAGYASASLNERAPGVGFGDVSGGDSYHVFRCIDPMNSDTYKDAAAGLF